MGSPWGPRDNFKCHRKYAKKALKAYRKAVQGDKEDTLVDLLVDLRHWADRSPYNFQDELDKSAICYQEEIDGR
ncbi:hypothetical protein LCGC14_2198200 [marine sediment metagenome]|uniref:Uncharacterized protein n=1 Tax=marine sediment metagenome TaxID=412755 RepID=A0A0F9E4N4_9ZZZZ